MDGVHQDTEGRRRIKNQFNIQRLRLIRSLMKEGSPYSMVS
jgi:hypothetical protein